MFSSESWVLILILEYNGLHQWLLFERIVDTACFGRALTRFCKIKQPQDVWKLCHISLPLAFNQEESVSLVSLSSKSSLFLAFKTIAKWRLPQVLNIAKSASFRCLQNLRRQTFQKQGPLLGNLLTGRHVTSVFQGLSLSLAPGDE